MRRRWSRHAAGCGDPAFIADGRGARSASAGSAGCSWWSAGPAASIRRPSDTACRGQPAGNGAGASTGQAAGDCHAATVGVRHSRCPRASGSGPEQVSRSARPARRGVVRSEGGTGARRRCTAARTTSGRHRAISAYGLDLCSRCRHQQLWRHRGCLAADRGDVAGRSAARRPRPPRRRLQFLKALRRSRRPCRNRPRPLPAGTIDGGDKFRAVRLPTSLGGDLSRLGTPGERAGYVPGEAVGGFIGRRHIGPFRTEPSRPYAGLRGGRHGDRSPSSSARRPQSYSRRLSRVVVHARSTAPGSGRRFGAAGRPSQGSLAASRMPVSGSMMFSLACASAARPPWCPASARPYSQANFSDSFSPGLTDASTLLPGGEYGGVPGGAQFQASGARFAASRSAPGRRTRCIRD